MNKNINKIIPPLILLIIISGCQFTENQSLKINEDYKEGVNGLNLKLIEKPRITEIYENSPFSLNIILENLGAHDIENGVLLLVFEDQYFKLINSDFTYFRLEGKSIYYPKGNQKLNSYQLESKNIKEKESIERETHLYLKSCYEYSTDFSQNICIDSDVYGLKKDKPCSPKENSLQGGQGAPIAVTKIETRMLYKNKENAIQPQFTIHLKNKGDGQVINKNNIHEICSPQSIKNEEIDVISLNVEMFSLKGNTQLDCEPKNPIKLKKGIAKINCISPELLSVDVGTYPSPLHITLNYGYTTTISKDIIIKRLST